MTSVRGRIARDLERIGGPQALSTPVIGVSAVVMLSVTAILDAVAGDAPAGKWAIVGLGSMAAAVGFLIIARVTVLPVRPRPPRPVMALLVFAIAGAIRYWALSLLVEALGLPAGSNRSVLTAAATTTVIMSLVTLTVCRADEHRTTLQRLTEERSRLLTLGATFEERVAASERALAEQVHAELDPALVEIEAILSDDAESEDAGPAVAVLSQAVSEIVRPMSHSLGATPGSASATIEDAIHDPEEFQVSQRLADIRDALRPGPTAALFAVLSLLALSSSRVPIAAPLIAVVFTAAVIWLVGSLARLLWPVRVKVPTVLPALGVLLTLNAVIGLIGSQLVALAQPVLAAQALTGQQIAPMERAPAWVGLTVTGIGFALSSLILAQRRLEAVEQDLLEVNDRLSIAVAQLRGQLWVNRRNLSWILHGPVQSALVSAAMEMNNPDLASADRSRIRQRIRQAIDTIDSTSRREARLEHALTEIASVWDFSCEVRNELSAEAVTRLSDDATATMAVIEVVREAVGNAVRHGGATEVDVRMSLPTPALVRVDVADNGSGITTDAEAGLGSGMLDEVTYRWERRNLPVGTLLEAYVPLQN